MPMSEIKTPYEDLLADVLENGIAKGDRTGTGTFSTFGRQIRYDLSEGFPLITTKKVHFKSVAYELLFFLRGETNVKWLQENGVKIWNEWASEDGELGPVYGFQWLHWGAGNKVTQRLPSLPENVTATYLGVANGSGKEGHPLKKTWEGMIARCYDPNNIGYSLYGGRGVSVCDEWLQFTNFARDAERLPGYAEKVSNLNVRYVLDKDTLGSGLLYGPKTCAWITDAENSLAKSSSIYTVEDSEGKLHRFTNPSQFCIEQGIPNNNFSDLWTGRKKAKIRHGFRFVSKEDAFSNTGINQIANVVESIKTNPDSRRHIVTAWNPAEVDDMALPPCHLLFQFYVADGKLSLQLYQRSADMFLGVPFNIASYALLLHMVAHQTDLEVGDFVWTGGDVHIYDNHQDQVKEQLSREPFDYPTLKFARKPESIFDYKYEDFIIEDYQHHPSIKAPVAV